MNNNCELKFNYLTTSIKVGDKELPLNENVKRSFELTLSKKLNPFCHKINALNGVIHVEVSGLGGTIESFKYKFEFAGEVPLESEIWASIGETQRLF